MTRLEETKPGCPIFSSFGITEPICAAPLNKNRFFFWSPTLTKKLHARRKEHFDQLIEERKTQLAQAEEALRKEVELNAELAKRYKILQVQGAQSFRKKFWKETSSQLRFMTIFIQSNSINSW